MRAREVTDRRRNGHVGSPSEKQDAPPLVQTDVLLYVHPRRDGTMQCSMDEERISRMSVTSGPSGQR